MVGPPGPDVVEDHPELSTTRLVVAWPGAAPPMRKNTSCNQRSGRPGSAVRARGPPAYLEQHRGVHRAGPKISPDSFTPGQTGHPHRAMPFAGTIVGKPSPSTTVSGRVTSMVWLQLVDAGGEDQVLSPGQRRVDHRGRVAWGGDEEPLEGNGCCRASAAGPGRSDRVVPHRRNEHAVAARRSPSAGTALPL